MPRSTTPKSAAAGGRTGRPPVTSRARILAAARQLIDRDGWDKLTVRRLAVELGIGSTTLYHHLRDKEDLLLLMLNEYVGQVPRPELPTDPAERIVTVAVAVRDLLAAWPWAAEVLTVDGFMGRFDDDARWFVEEILAAAVAGGCSHDQSVQVFRHIWYYTVGEVLVRSRSVGVRGPDGQPVDPAFRRSLDESRLAHVAAVADTWSVLAVEDTYAAGVRAFAHGMLVRA
ncbi:helix-turn-helix domain-containing protein [Kribbella sp.]|uniref:TetR/AcrR family transcriptional regulator n=1 Tax=Kribbella sp. TaxID=1871183 RepID=UPI002D35361B|nr:helix-turn-helix domain-containing protein [Kribbella sp.]HZX03269.1 helix-turn-helix domain-containing protein [Kribbella sp.]